MNFWHHEHLHVDVHLAVVLAWIMCDLQLPLHSQLNCVVMNGVNEDEICDFVALTETKVSIQTAQLQQVGHNPLASSDSYMYMHHECCRCPHNHIRIYVCNNTGRYTVGDSRT